MMEIQVDRGLEPPKPREVLAYPYLEMEVGDSFAVPVAARRKVLNANCKAAKRYGWRFVARTEVDSRSGEVMVRTWRIE